MTKKKRFQIGQEVTLICPTEWIDDGTTKADTPFPSFGKIYRVMRYYKYVKKGVNGNPKSGWTIMLFELGERGYYGEYGFAPVVSDKILFQDICNIKAGEHEHG